ncbi:MAG TPA: zinc metalloprotease HtpX [Candidatus Deferrimicrobiaceae bacterium]|nr:zinc metalloprotease HtpX [Candidatus Deferrimicrobiaceae bacterium]
MNAWKLRFSMVATLAAIFGLTTLVFSAVLLWVGYFNLITVGVLVVVLNVGQWLLSPYLVGAIYRVKEMKADENPKLHQMVADLSKKSGISTPKLMLSRMPMPNAFAYGSPLSGSRVAVTEGLIKHLDGGEVEAVIGHELGHLKHRDVQIMMVVSFLPALFYYIGYSMMLSGMFGGDRREGGGGGNNALFGIAFMAFSWVLTLFTLYLSRIREYYADRHSASVVENGAEKLSTGLVTIVEESKRSSKLTRDQAKNNSAFKALFISDPDRANLDSAELHSNNFTNKRDLLKQTLSRPVKGSDTFAEIFSTHPNIIKRLRALQELSQNPQSP